MTTIRALKPGSPSTARAAERKPAVITERGLIKGGRLDGWRYRFERFVVGHDGYMLVEAMVTPPNWPFPKTLRMRGGVHFGTLRAISGDRAKRLDAWPLIDAARAAHNATLEACA